MQASSKKLFNHVVALLNKALAFRVVWPAINNCDLAWPLLDNAMNDFIHKFLAITWVENPGNSRDGEYVVLEVECYFCSRLSLQSKQDMKFGLSM